MDGRITRHPWAYMDSGVFGFVDFVQSTTRQELERLAT